MTSSLRSLYHMLLYSCLYRFRLHRRVVTHVSGFELLIKPTVIHPGIFKSGELFARFLSRSDLRGLQVLDMGTGSGILALAAARQGAHVTAVDINLEAVQCAVENARRNGFAGSINIFEGDLFVPLTGQTYDMIVFNPPYLSGARDSRYSVALHAGEDLAVIQRFASVADRFLNRDGSLLMISSTDSPLDRFLEIFRERGYSHELLERIKIPFEEFLIFRFTLQ